MKPLLSIVIANFNYGRFLEAAIKSVLDQSVGEDVELLICDAGSTDNSLEVIERYKNCISWWCSEKDKGQSDAFNKGFSHARGKYLTWLNADDLLVPGSLKKVIAAFRAYPECQWFTGNFYRFTDNGRIVEVGWGPHWYPDCLQRDSSPLVIFGPTSFFSKEIFDRVGGMDETLHYIMDNDLWYRFMRAGVKLRRIRCFCWAFRMHNASKTAEFGMHVLSSEVQEKMHKEKEYVLRKTGYRQSKILRVLLLTLRIFDGSFLRKAYYIKAHKGVYGI